jgi:HK97 family phage prohead protease
MKHELNPPRLEKTYDATVKATGRSGTALVSVFHNVDLQGDRVLPGAFRRTISEWKSKMARGIRPPFVWSHQWSDPDAYLGPITGLRETAKGLEVDFDITSPSETAKQVQYLLREGLVTQMSFAYNVWEEDRATDGTHANELKALDLIEAGPTLRGANDLTDLVALKTSSTSTTAATFSVKESTETRTLRNHLDSNHAQPVRAYQRDVAELIIRHRLLHADLNTPVTERHITTGVPDGKTAPVTTVPKSSDLVARAREVERDAMLRKAAEQGRLRQVASVNDTLKASDALPEDDDWTYEEADLGWSQMIENYVARQAEADRVAVEDLLADTSETFQMEIDPATGELRDPS